MHSYERSRPEQGLRGRASRRIPGPRAGVGRAGGRAAAQAEHVLHVEQARAALHDESAGPQAALRIGGAAARAVGDLDAFAGAGEQHGVVADDVTAADHREADRAGRTLAGDAMARPGGELVEVAPQGARDRPAHAERGPRRGIDLVAVVGLDDLDVVAVAQQRGGHLQQAEGHVHAHAHVRREHDADAGGGGLDLAAAGLVEAGGADHHPHAARRAFVQMAQRALGPGEVDQHVGAAECLVEIRRDRDAGGPAQRFARIAADARRTRDVERTDQLDLGRVEHRLDQHPSHPARGPRDRDAQAHRKRPCLRR